MFLLPPDSVAELMNTILPGWLQVFLGVAEVLAGVGLTLPGVTGIKPWLVPDDRKPSRLSFDTER